MNPGSYLGDFFQYTECGRNAERRQAFRGIGQLPQHGHSSPEIHALNFNQQFIVLPVIRFIFVSSGSSWKGRPCDT